MVIDDIGVREASQAQSEAMLLLLNERRAKPMILTGNLKPSELNKAYDDRIVSRLTAGIVIEVTGGDQRAQGSIHLRA